MTHSASIELRPRSAIIEGSETLTIVASMMIRAVPIPMNSIGIHPCAGFSIGAAGLTAADTRAEPTGRVAAQSDRSDRLQVEAILPVVHVGLVLTVVQVR